MDLEIEAYGIFIFNSISECTNVLGGNVELVFGFRRRHCQW
jgi:hypothetical protein